MSASDEDELIPNRVARWFYTLLIIAGISVYLSWGILFGVWWDLGLYSVVVVLLGFGIVGYLLYSHLESEEAKEDEKSTGRR